MNSFHIVPTDSCHRKFPAEGEGKGEEQIALGILGRLPMTVGSGTHTVLEKVAFLWMRSRDEQNQETRLPQIPEQEDPPLKT